MRTIICRTREIRLYAVCQTRCSAVRKIPLLFKKLKTVLLWHMYLCKQHGLFYSAQISSRDFFLPLRPTNCMYPRSQSRLRCYHGNLCRIVLPYFTVDDIALGQHYGIKT
jgi:hypothetical protein